MAFANGYALLIGVGSYTHVPRLNVPITADDARAVAQVLGDPAFCGYPAEHITLLSNEQASRASILAHLDTLASKANDAATVCIFYAGHGEYGDDGYYLTTNDTQLTGRNVVQGTGLRERELIDKIRAIRAKRVLLIINACHSGEISPVLAAGEESSTGTPVPPDVSAALLATGEGRIIITACRENQFSYIGPGPLTLFTQALVDGLQGKGVRSNHGYISVFDLYTHLYYRLEDAVMQKISAAARQTYSEKQEPELTILKGVGPFAVSLYRGANTATLGDFDASGTAPEETAVRTVSHKYSEAMLRQHHQTISGNAQVGVAISGDVHGGITQTTQSGGINLGSNTTFSQTGDSIAGDKVAGDKVLGDKIQTGTIHGNGIAIGRGAQSIVRHVQTSGDYAEGTIDKRSGTFVGDDQYTMSGNFSGAMLNIKSTLHTVSQIIGSMPHGNSSDKAQLTILIAQLSAELAKVPPSNMSEAEAVAETAKAVIEQASKAQPNKTLVQISVEGLKQAAQNLAAVLPVILPLAQQVAEVIKNITK